MDVNETRFHLLLGKANWSPLIRGADLPCQTDLFWDEERTGLSLHPLLFRFPTPPGDREPRPEDRRGAGRDRYGNWYWVDDTETEIRFLPFERRRSEHFWSFKDMGETCEQKRRGEFQPLMLPQHVPLQLRGLAVTEHHYLVVGTLEPAGLLIFDLHAGGPPVQVLWPSGVPFAPFDMAPAPGGGVWILDCDPDPDVEWEARYWALDRYFRVVAADQAEVEIESPRVHDFRPVDGEPRERRARTFPVGISLELASPVETRHPLAIEALPDGTVLILDSDPEVAFSTIYRYRWGQQLGPGVTLEHVLETCVDAEDGVGEYALLLRGHDIAFVPGQEGERGQVIGTLYVVAPEGNQSFAFDLVADQAGLSLDPLPRYLPMRLFRGKGLVAAGQEVYYDLQDVWVPLAEQRRPRYRLAGTLETNTFDGREPDCVWHRLFLDACIPPDTEVLVESRAANRPDLLAQTPWQAEPRLYCRETGSELPYYEPFTLEKAGQDGTGTWELLLQHAEGRYLQLRLTLRGSGRNTPLLQALRVYYPRFSYLKEYLPAVYQHDEASASFLDRFLANMEGTYTTLEGKIAAAQTLFDVRTVAADYLDWLATWFGVTMDPAWDERRRRLFLTHAVELFRQRGTLAGMIRSIRLAIDPCVDESLFTEPVGDLECTSASQFARFSVRIVERFLTRRAPGVLFGDPTEPDIPRLVASTAPWSPEQGAEPIHQRYRAFLKARYGDENAWAEAWGPGFTPLDDMRFSPVLPANAAEVEDWRAFTSREIGFHYAEVTSADEPAYQTFLAQRYQQISRLNHAYRSSYNRFAEVTLPGENDMPATKPRLHDWIQFVSLVLPIKRYAHHFTVLVPIAPQGDSTTQAQQLALVERIVRSEKPAHTQFDVKPYWALFRVGEARLGLDTLLGAGSRFVALLLGSGYLAGGYLGSTHPWDVKDRFVTGRDRAGQEMVL